MQIIPGKQRAETWAMPGVRAALERDGDGGFFRLLADVLGERVKQQSQRVKVV